MREVWYTRHSLQKWLEINITMQLSKEYSEDSSLSGLYPFPILSAKLDN
jgi:hypothetical protein